MSRCTGDEGDGATWQPEGKVKVTNVASRAIHYAADVGAGIHTVRSGFHSGNIPRGSANGVGAGRIQPLSLLVYSNASLASHIWTDHPSGSSGNDTRTDTPRDQVSSLGLLRLHKSETA